MAGLPGSRTEANLRTALADEAEASRLYACCAEAADAGGFGSLAAALRTAAEQEAGRGTVHAGYLPARFEWRAAAQTEAQLARQAISITSEHAAIYAGMAHTAQDEGFDDIADWFLTLAKAGRSRIHRFQNAVDGREQHRIAAGRGFDG
jgi:rubrerythrin